MVRITRTVYLGERNKELSSTFQPPKEGQSVQPPKRCDKHGDKDEDNSSKNVNNELYDYLHIISFGWEFLQQYTTLLLWL